MFLFKEQNVVITLDTKCPTELSNDKNNRDAPSDCEQNEADEIEILMNVPLYLVAILNSGRDTFESLERFVAAILSPLGEDLDIQVNRQKDVGKMILHSVLNNCRGECQDCPQQLLRIYSVEIGMLPLNMPR